MRNPFSVLLEAKHLKITKSPEGNIDKTFPTRASSTAGDEDPFSFWRGCFYSTLSCISTDRHLYIGEQRHPVHLVWPWPWGPEDSALVLPTLRLVYSCLLHALSLCLHRASFRSPSHGASLSSHGFLCPSSLLLLVLRTLSLIPEAGSKLYSALLC